MLYQFALQAIGRIDSDKTTAADLAARTPAERLADAQLLVLQAIYRELRHGNDLAAAQTTALAEHSEALTDHADQMGRRSSWWRGSPSRCSPSKAADGCYLLGAGPALRCGRVRRQGVPCAV